MINITLNQSAYIDVTLESEPIEGKNERVVKFSSMSPDLQIIGISEFGFPVENWDQPNQIELFSETVGEYELHYEVTSNYTNEVKTGQIIINVEEESTGESIILINTYNDRWNTNTNNYVIYKIENDSVVYHNRYDDVMDGLTNLVHPIHLNIGLNGGINNQEYWFRESSELHKIDDNKYMLFQITTSEDSGIESNNQPTVVSENMFSEDSSSLILTDQMLPTYPTISWRTQIRKIMFDNGVDHIWYTSQISNGIDINGKIFKREFDPSDNYSFTDTLIADSDDSDVPVPMPRPSPDRRYVIWQEGKRMIQFVHDSDDMFYTDDLENWYKIENNYPFEVTRQLSTGPETLRCTPYPNDPFIYFNSRIIILGEIYFKRIPQDISMPPGQPGLYLSSTDNGVTWEHYQLPYLHRNWFGIVAFAYKPNSDIGICYSDGVDYQSNSDRYPYFFVTTDGGATYSQVMMPYSGYEPNVKWEYQNYEEDFEIDEQVVSIFYNKTNDSFYIFIRIYGSDTTSWDEIPMAFAFYCPASHDMSVRENWKEINCTELNNDILDKYGNDPWDIVYNNFDFILER